MLSISLQCSTLCLYFFSLLPAQTHSANIWTERSCVVCSNTFWFAWNFSVLQKAKVQEINSD